MNKKISEIEIPLFNERALKALLICVVICKENKITTLKVLEDQLKFDKAMIFDLIVKMKATGKIHGTRGNRGGYICDKTLTLREIAIALNPCIKTENEFIGKCINKNLYKFFDATIEDFLF